MGWSSESTTFPLITQFPNAFALKPASTRKTPIPISLSLIIFSFNPQHELISDYRMQKPQKFQKKFQKKYNYLVIK